MLNLRIMRGQEEEKKEEDGKKVVEKIERGKEDKKRKR